MASVKLCRMMGRSARFATGLCLLGFAALIELTRRSAYDPEYLLWTELVFAIPGLWFALSSLPRRLPESAAPHVTKMFVLDRLVGGLCVTVVGAVMLFLIVHIFSRVPALVLFVFIAAIPFGVFMAVRSWTDACGTCRLPLREHLARFNLDQAPAVASAVSGANAADLLALHGGGVAAKPSRTVLAVQYCERCLQVAVVELHGHPRAVWSGESVKTVVEGLLSHRAADEQWSV
jgi:hypothetical protein